MTGTASTALDIALAYHEAWKNLNHADGAIPLVAEAVVSETPFGTLEGAAALRRSEADFADMLTGATMIASYGDTTSACLIYYTHTRPVPSVLSAKYFAVDNGKITHIKAIFDKSVFGQI